MKSLNRKQLVLSLIKDDLINLKLVHTLNELGLSADCYTLYTSTTVFNLMHFKTTNLRWEKIHDGYIDLTRKVMQIDIQDSPRMLQALSEEIYAYLKSERKESIET